MIRIKNIFQKSCNNKRNAKIENRAKNQVKKMIIKIMSHFRHILSMVLPILEIILLIFELLFVPICLFLSTYVGGKYGGFFMSASYAMTAALIVGFSLGSSANFTPTKVFLIFIPLFVVSTIVLIIAAPNEFSTFLHLFN